MNSSTRNIVLTVAMVAAVVVAIAAGTNNYVQPGDSITLTFSAASPAAGEPAIKCATKATGGIVGVSLNGLGTAGENNSIATKGVFDLLVTASSTVGNIGVGDYIYAVVSNVNSGTTTLSNINSGLLFGVALEGITASTTDGVYERINVMLRQPGHL